MRFLKLLTLLGLLLTYSFGQTYWIAREPSSTVTAAEAQAIAVLADAIDGIAAAEADILYTIATGGALTLGSLTVDNLFIDANDISSTAGDITITPLATNDIVLDGHWEVDGPLITGITDNNTTITAYAGKNVTIDGTTFDGGVVAGISTLTATGKLSTTVITEQLRLNYDASNYAAWTVAADGALTLVTVDNAAAEGDINFNPDGFVGIKTAVPTVELDVTGAGLFSGALDVGGDFTPASITMAQTQASNDYTWLQYNQWSTSADMAAGGTYGAYNKLNIGNTVQNAIAGKSTVRYLTLAADETVNYAAGFEATLELDDVSTHTLTVTDHLSALNLYFDGIGQVEGVGGGAYSKMNLSRALWNSTANFAIETNGYQIETAPNSYLDYGFNVYNDGTMQAGLWIHNNPAHGTMVSDIKTSSGAMIFTGTAANGDAVYAEVGAVDATGSIYLSTAAGDLFIQVANAGAATDWERMTSADTD